MGNITTRSGSTTAIPSHHRRSKLEAVDQAVRWGERYGIHLDRKMLNLLKKY